MDPKKSVLITILNKFRVISNEQLQIFLSKFHLKCVLNQSFFFVCFHFECNPNRLWLLYQRRLGFFDVGEARGAEEADGDAATVGTIGAVKF